MSAAPEHVRVSVVGGRTQLDVALPVDVAVASLLPELVKLVRSRDVEASTDTPWAATRDAFWVLSRLDPPVALELDQTLRASGVIDGELLRLTDERALAAPTLYDDVVDAAARLNKAAYAGWNADAARWMSFGGLGFASLIWVYFLAAAPNGAQRPIMVGLATAVAAAMVGVAALARRSYKRSDVGAAVGWSAIPIVAAIVWLLVRGFGEYGTAAGCASLVVLNAATHRALGCGRWGYLATGVVFATTGLAMLGHALGVSVRVAAVVLAVVGTLGCLTVARLTHSLARVEPSTSRPGSDQAADTSETQFAPKPSAIDSDATSASAPSFGAMPTAEAVWARVRAAAVTRSALYAGLAISVLCGAAAVLRAEPGVRWPGLGFAAVCATALSVHARLPQTLAERMSLGVPAAALAVLLCASAFCGTAAMVSAGLSTLLAAAVVTSIVGLRVAGSKRPQRCATAWAYLHYAAYAALIPAALWVAGGCSQLEIS
ncbi:type VII secretion integral membrane protein EccD [Mycobacterium sp. SP-6446]|nr:type VII secretion integral membrane protein EccD [Mycobacterium sp. SP-6446]